MQKKTLYINRGVHSSTWYKVWHYGNESKNTRSDSHVANNLIHGSLDINLDINVQVTTNNNITSTNL